MYNLADYLKPWNFDFTVNTEAQPYLPLTFINDYTYELGIDTDPSEDTDFTIKFDPVIINQTVSLSLGAPPDHALGTGATTYAPSPGYNCVGDSTSINTPNCATYPCSDVAGGCTTYLVLIGEKTVLQQSWLAWWYCSLSSDPSSCGDTPETYFLQDGGIYDIYWAVLDKDNGKTIGKVQNRVYVINTTAIA